MIVDSGMTGAIIAKKEVSNVDYSTLFIYNISTSIILYTFLYSISPIIAHLYKTPELTLIIKIISLSIIFNSFYIVQFIKLLRNHEYKLLAIITFISQFFSAIISICIAYIWHEVWALVALHIMPNIINLFIISLLKREKISLQFSKKSLEEQIRFGIPLLLSNLILIFYSNIINSIIGKMYSLTQAGYYSQASKLQQIPTGVLETVVDRVLFNILSKKENLEEIKSESIKINKHIYMISFFIIFIIIIISKPFFTYILGKQWAEAAWMFEILVYSTIPMIIKILGRNLLKSTGQTNIILKMEVINMLFGITVLLITSLISIKYMLYGIIFSNVFMAINCLNYISVSLPYSMTEQISTFIKPLLTMLIMIFLIKTYISG